MVAIFGAILLVHEYIGRHGATKLKLVPSWLKSAKIREYGGGTERESGDHKFAVGSFMRIMGNHCSFVLQKIYM